MSQPEVKDPATLDTYARLADAVVDVARELRLSSSAERGSELLTQSQSQVMRFIHAHDGCSATEIATATGLQRANVSRALAELGRLGFVESTRGTRDARTITVSATDLAWHTIASLRASWAQALQRAWPTSAGTTADSVADTLESVLGLLTTRRDTALTE